MANHLDDIVLVEKSGKLQPSIGVDAIITPEDRVDYLRNKTGVEIQDVRLEDWNASVVSDSTQLLIVRSVGIDTAGENDKLNGLAAMEREMIRLARLIEDCKRLKFDMAVIVADHVSCFNRHSVLVIRFRSLLVTTLFSKNQECLLVI